MWSVSKALWISLFTGAICAVDLASAMDEVASSVVAEPTRWAYGLDNRVALLQSKPNEELARQSLDVLVPLADRVGLAPQRAALEDACFSVLEPTEAASLRQLLPSTSEDLQALESLEQALAASLSALGFEGETSSRVKSLYSLHKKMKRKNLDLHQVDDRLAVRVKVSDERQCYEVLDAVSERFQTVGDIDDYIKAPKASGYRSLHTVVSLPQGLAEIQIRTFEMHEEAEQGPAAHWRYKLSA